MSTFHATAELEDAALLANFSNLPLLLHDISTFAGYKSQLARVEVISEPRFKGKHGVADLRKSLSALEVLLNSIDVDQQPNAGSTVFVVILRGDIETFLINSVESCQLIVTELPGFEILKLIWPASPDTPLLLTSPVSSAYPRTFHLPRSMMDRLLILSAAGTSFFFRDVGEPRSDPVRARPILGTTADRPFDRAISRPVAIRPQSFSDAIHHGISPSMSDDLDHLLAIDDGYSETADFSSDSLTAPTAPRPPSDPRPLRSAFDPTYARRSTAPVHEDTSAPDTVAPASEASTASAFFFMMRQQQEQQLRREEQQMMREREYREEHRQELLAERERRDRERREDYQQHREDAQQHRTDMMQMMSALAAQASAPPSPVRPIAVISTKSDAKLAEAKSIVDIRGMFDTAGRYDSVFAVQIEHEIPVTNTVHALSHFRATLKANCRINTPDLTDAQLKSAMFLHFEMGKSGISIVDFRPKNVLKVDSISALGKVMGLASRVYSDFFGPHIRCGFERLKSDLDLLVDQLHGSINTSAAIELVDASIAATRDFFRYDHDATPLDC